MRNVYYIILHIYCFIEFANYQLGVTPSDLLSVAEILKQRVVRNLYNQTLLFSSHWFLNSTNCYTWNKLLRKLIVTITVYD